MDAPSCQGIHLTPHRYLMLQRSPRSHVEGGERRCALGVGFVDGTLAFAVNTIVFDAVSTQNIYLSAGGDSFGPLCVAAYLSFCREELTSNAFAREAAPCGPISFPSSLGAEKGTSRQRVVTVGNGAGGSVLDARERLIDGECTRQMFGSLFLQ